jgi:hypothetical protein
VLLICRANVDNLLLARGTVRTGCAWWQPLEAQADEPPLRFHGQRGERFDVPLSRHARTIGNAEHAEHSFLCVLGGLCVHLCSVTRRRLAGVDAKFAGCFEKFTSSSLCVDIGQTPSAARSGWARF